MNLNITASDLMKRQNELNKSIAQFAQEKSLSNESVEPIYDGVADAEQYLSSKRKIMWIMKEPYDELDANNNPRGGGWSIPADCLTGFGEDKKDPKPDACTSKTYQPIIYAMYGYFNNVKWDDMSWIKDDKDMVRILQKIAIINVSKMPGATISNNDQIWKYYQLWKDYLYAQIDLYVPDVLVFANTFNHFKHDLGLDGDKYRPEYGEAYLLDAYVKDNRLYLDAYHPNQRFMKREKYVNSIINAIQAFDNR
jgi:hypothetical protein